MRNENSAYGSISLTLGIISLILMGISLRLGWYLYVFMGYVLVFAIPIITIIYGIVGMAKDNNIPMAIIGLNCGLAVIIMITIRYFGIFSWPF